MVRYPHFVPNYLCLCLPAQATVQGPLSFQGCFAANLANFDIVMQSQVLPSLFQSRNLAASA